MSTYDKRLSAALAEENLEAVIENVSSLAALAGMNIGREIDPGDRLSAAYYARELLKDAIRKEADARDQLAWARPARERLEAAYNLLARRLKEDDAK